MIKSKMQLKINCGEKYANSILESPIISEKNVLCGRFRSAEDFENNIR